LQIIQINWIKGGGCWKTLKIELKKINILKIKMEKIFEG